MCLVNSCIWMYFIILDSYFKRLQLNIMSFDCYNYYKYCLQSFNFWTYTFTFHTISRLQDTLACWYLWKNNGILISNESCDYVFSVLLVQYGITLITDDKVHNIRCDQWSYNVINLMLLGENLLLVIPKILCILMFIRVRSFKVSLKMWLIYQ